jgi:hypothetical protein
VNNAGTGAALVTEVPLGRLGLSEEDRAIVFIAADEASYTTGHIPNVDGGHTANWDVRPSKPRPGPPPQVKMLIQGEEPQ